MKYFRVDAYSVEWCGFDSSFYFQAESETALESSREFEAMEEYMFDYISGTFDEDEFETDEEFDESAAVGYTIEEISEEEYLEYKDDNYI